MLDQSNPQASLLRDMFVFKIIPMINPDGVRRGHFRTDGFGKNLNRYYSDPEQRCQPSVFAICKLINYLQDDKRIFFFCDFHAHGSFKDNFFYGNSLGFLMQVESRAFAKIMEINNPSFSYDSCDFSQKQMGTKEFNPLEKAPRSKEQCSRVATFRYSHLIHSFTLEIGYHSSKKKDPTTGAQTPFSRACFEKVGQDLLISLLDLFERNPASKLPASAHSSLANIRKDIADEIKSCFRIREVNVSKKVTQVHEMIEEGYYQEVVSLHRDQTEPRQTNRVRGSLASEKTAGVDPPVPSRRFLFSRRKEEEEKEPNDIRERTGIEVERNSFSLLQPSSSEAADDAGVELKKVRP